jgi:hypothetical protein
MKNFFEDNGAEFSPDRKYRYCLWRIWDDGKPFVMFIGLNPSTANEYSDDPTIRRIKRLTFNWGYGGFYMLNLFAYVSSDPKELKKCADPLGDNDKWLLWAKPKCDKVIFAWGKFKEAKERSKEVVKMFPKALALVINNDGSPRHPLYVKSDTLPISYKIDL